MSFLKQPKVHFSLFLLSKELQKTFKKRAFANLYFLSEKRAKTAFILRGPFF
jgi:hypothetical protein